MTGLGFNARRRALVTVIAVFALVSGTAATVLAFDDVPDGSFFEDAVVWMDDQDITSGRTADLFDPDATVTRAELITFFWRFAGEPAADPSTFTDVTPGSFAETAIGWAQDMGLTTGRTATLFDPGATANRAEVLTYLWRYMCRPAAVATHTFTDVTAGSFYEAAVAWAYPDVTTGRTATILDPAGTANRAEAATFLWRLAGEPAPGDPGDNRTTGLPTCNTAPVLAEIGPKVVADTVELSFTATATDTDVPAQTLTFTLDAGAAGAVPTGATITTDGDFTWTPTESQDGVATFDVVVTDDGDPVMEDRETITVTVTEGNTSPSDPDEGTAGAPAFTAIGNTQLQGTGGTAAASGLATTTTAVNLLTGATDPDTPAQTLAVVAATGASAEGGAFEVFADGTFTYVSAPGYTGVDSFTYSVCDDFSTPACDGSTAFITVADTVFYVDAVTGDDGTGDGTSVAPFASLAPLDSGGSADVTDSAGDIIYVLDPTGGVVDGGITLENQQQLLGQGVDLTVGATTLIGATDKPTIRSTAGAGITLAADNTVRGLDVDAAGAGVKGITGTSIGMLTISDVDTVSTTNNTAVDIQGPGTATVTIGSVASPGATALKIGNQSASAYTFTTVSSDTSGSGHGVDIFGLSGSSTVDLGTVTINRTGTGHGIHVLNSLGSTVSSTGGTVSAQATAVFGLNAELGLVLGSVSADGAVNGGADPGISLVNQEGTFTITGDGVVDGNGSGGTIQNKTGAGILLNGAKGLSFTELNVTTTGGHGIDATNLRSGPVTFRGGVISGVAAAFNAIDITANANSNVVIVQMVIDSGTDGIKLAANTTANAKITNNTIGATTPYPGRAINIDAAGAGTVATHIDNNTLTNNSTNPTVDLVASAAGADLQATVTNNTITNSGAGNEASTDAQSTSTACLDYDLNAIGVVDLTVAAGAALSVRHADVATMQTANAASTVNQTGTPVFTGAGTCTLPPF